MGFLNPLWLIGTVSAAVPLLIHLVGRRRESRVDFSSLKLLREVDRRRNLWLRVKRILLLAIRMAICAAIFLLLARPVVNVDYGTFTHAPTRACLIIDDSPSVSAHGGKVFLAVKEKALEILQHFDEKDEILVLTTSGDAELGASSNYPVIVNHIRELCTSYKVAHLKVVLDRVKSHLEASTKLNRIAYLISDLQAVNFRGVEKSDLTDVVLIDIGREVENVSITDVMTEELFSPRGSSKLRITLTNHSPLELNQQIGVWLDEEKVQVNEVTLPPSSDITLALEIAVTSPGYHSGYVKLMEDDDFIFDNIRYFTLQVPTEIPVLIIAEDMSEGVYLEKALRPKDEVFTPFTVEVISPKKMLTRDLLAYKVIAVSNVRGIEFGALKMLQQYFEDGGKVCIFLGDRIDVDFYNMTVLSDFQTHADPPVQMVQPSFISVNRVELTHPVFSLFKEKRFGDLSLSRFYSYLPLETLPDQIVGWFSNGKPAIIDAPEKGILCAFSLAHTDITKRAIFVPLVHRLFYYLAKKQESPRAVLVGERFMMGIPQSFRSMTCVTPGGERIRIIPKPLRAEIVITFADTDEPGIYTVEADGQCLALFPVNIHPEESQAAKLSAEQLESMLGPDHNIWSADDVVAEMGFDSYELTKSILWILLGLTFLEVLLVHRR